MNTIIHFFGGYKASAEDVARWKNSAIAQRPDHLRVHAYGWPHGASASNPLAEYDDSRMIAGQILDGYSDEHIIVGHSSGCAFANAVADQLLRRATPKLNWRLVALDGFRPDIHLLDRPSTQCWSAKGYTGERSLNYSALDTAPNFHIFRAEPDCTKTWSLHFSLVNAAANDHTVTGISSGYADVVANLCFLESAA